MVNFMKCYTNGLGPSKYHPIERIRLSTKLHGGGAGRYAPETSTTIPNVLNLTCTISTIDSTGAWFGGAPRQDGRQQLPGRISHFEPKDP